MSDTTGLLLRWNSGEEDARGKLMEQLYGELSAMAAAQLEHEHHSQFQPNELVHEAYLRLIDMSRITWADRAHFKAMAGRVMRQVLIDHARKRKAAKRDGGVQVTLTGISRPGDTPHTDVMMLNAAIERLRRIDSERARLVELLFFGGLTIEEAAEVVGCSPRTLKRQWAVVRGWLYRELVQGRPSAEKH